MKIKLTGLTCLLIVVAACAGIEPTDTSPELPANDLAQEQARRDLMAVFGVSDEQKLTISLPRLVPSKPASYIVWPGQTLAYKLGQLSILQLRTEAEQRLGDTFDIRAFHDQVLRSGALPIPILEVKVRAWIADQKDRRATHHPQENL